MAYAILSNFKCPRCRHRVRYVAQCRLDQFSAPDVTSEAPNMLSIFYRLYIFIYICICIYICWLAFGRFGRSPTGFGLFGSGLFRFHNYMKFWWGAAAPHTPRVGAAARQGADGGNRVRGARRGTDQRPGGGPASQGLRRGTGRTRLIGNPRFSTNRESFDGASPLFMVKDLLTRNRKLHNRVNKS